LKFKETQQKIRQLDGVYEYFYIFMPLIFRYFA